MEQESPQKLTSWTIIIFQYQTSNNNLTDSPTKKTTNGRWSYKKVLYKHKIIMVLLLTFCLVNTGWSKCEIIG